MKGKQIYTTVIKILPSSNLFITKDVTIDNFNMLNRAYYNLFNSNLLTRKDYAHLFNVIIEKMPIYEVSKDAEQLKEIVYSYATFNYPVNPDFKIVIDRFLSELVKLQPYLINNSLYSIKKKLDDCSEFVGIELIQQNKFFKDDLTSNELETIKKIILV